jgi:hypothetical protein
VLRPVSKNFHNIRFSRRLFIFKLKKLFFVAPVPLWICLCASGATGHLVLTKKEGFEFACQSKELSFFHSLLLLIFFRRKRQGFHIKTILHD